MKVGIVCEGIHDFPALSVLLTELAQAKGIAEISCVALQPQADASSRSGDGGWTKVAGWCLEKSGSGLDTYLNAPLFEGEDKFDAIVIHLDGDIAGACALKYNFTLPDPLSVDERVATMSGWIAGWLKPSHEHQPKIRSAIPTQMTESWMLAGLSVKTHDWENVAAKELFLEETGFSGSRKAAHYQAMSVKLAGTTSRIAGRCRSFELFAAEVI